jgi:hypothetical protein
MCRFVIHCITLVVAGNPSAQYVRCARCGRVGSRAADSPSCSRARSRTRVLLTPGPDAKKKKKKKKNAGEKKPRLSPGLLGSRG